MEANTQGRRPTGPGAYLYRDVQPVIVDRDGDGTLVAAYYIWHPQYPEAHILMLECEDVSDMPGEFVPLAKPVAAPEPDWSSAPEWATGHQYGASGDGIWTAPGRSELSGLKLPLGCDWRTTLKRRPEADNELP